MKVFPELKTERLLLTELNNVDIPDIVEYAGNKNISDTTQNIPHPYTEKDAVFRINAAAQGFQSKQQYTFAIKLQKTREFVGGIGMRVEVRHSRAELGYWVAEPYWNNGYASEATKAVLEFGFKELGLHKIFATHLEQNSASGKVMVKNGMVREGELKDHTCKDGHFHTLIQYRLTRDEFILLNSNE